jgi:hypothetical protein
VAFESLVLIIRRGCGGEGGVRGTGYTKSENEGDFDGGVDDAEDEGCGGRFVYWPVARLALVS